MSFSWKENLPKELNDKVTKVEKMIQPRLEKLRIFMPIILKQMML